MLHFYNTKKALFIYIFFNLFTFAVYNHLKFKLTMITFKKISILISIIFLLASCKNGKLPGADARKVPYDPKERVKRNLEQGKGFRLNNVISGNERGGDFQFASSNELWRASLDVIDFMPLASANYSGGMIITDWYTDSNNSSESIKITIRFLTNEIRSDALDVNVFYKKCSKDLTNCIVNKKNNELKDQITLSILKKASQYEKERIEKYKKENPYEYSTPTKKEDKNKN